MDPMGYGGISLGKVPYIMLSLSQLSTDELVRRISEKNDERIHLSGSGFKASS